MGILFIPLMFIVAVWTTWTGRILGSILLVFGGYVSGKYLTFDALIVLTSIFGIGALAMLVWVMSYVFARDTHSKEAGFVFLFALIYWWIFALFYGVAWITYYDMTGQTWLGDAFLWIKSYIIR